MVGIDSPRARRLFLFLTVAWLFAAVGPLEPGPMIAAAQGDGAAPAQAGVTPPGESAAGSSVPIDGASADVAAGAATEVATEPGGPAERYRVPAPSERGAFWALSFHSAWFVPVAADALCPARVDCVMNGGFQVRFGAERRWASGFALGGSYEATLLDSDAAYEIGVLQGLRVLGRYLFPSATNLHPFVGVGAGPSLFGETFGVDTAGAAVDLVVGAEVELTDTLWVSVALPWRILYLAPFTTESDGVRRAKSGATTAFMLEVGLEVLGAP